MEFYDDRLDQTKNALKYLTGALLILVRRLQLFWNFKPTSFLPSFLYFNEWSEIHESWRHHRTAKTHSTVLYKLGSKNQL